MHFHFIHSFYSLIACFQVVLRRRCDLSANILGMKPATDKGKYHFKPQGAPTFSKNLVSHKRLTFSGLFSPTLAFICHCPRLHTRVTELASKPNIAIC